MGFEAMRRSLLAGLVLLSLSACGKEKAAAPESDEGAGPQIATSIEDYALPVDKSDQMTAIDAATGDAGGMPRDGGAVVRLTKPEAAEAVEADGSNAAAPVSAPPPPPLVVPPPAVVVPPPVTPPAAPPAPAPAPGA